MISTGSALSGFDFPALGSRNLQDVLRVSPANASVDRLTIGRIDNRPDPEGTPTPPRSPHRQHFHRARVAFAGARRARHWREIFAETDARFLQRAGGARCAE